MAKILVIQTAFLGDAALTTPLFRALSSQADRYDVTALTTPQGAELLGYPGPLAAGLKQVVVYDKHGKDRGLKNFLSLAGKLRNEKFDIVVSPHRSLRSAALAWLTKAPVRIGFDENALPLLWTHRVRRRRELHEVERNLELLAPLGGIPAGFIPKLEVAIVPAAESSAEKLCGEFLSSPLRIGIAPGSVWGAKRWPPENFSKAIDGIGKERRAKFVLIGGPGDVETAAAVKENSNSEILDLVGKTTINEMTAIIGRLHLFITNDTGPMHVAAALDIPTVAIFGATTPAQGFSPYSKKARVVEAPNPPDCRPCSAHGPNKCPKDHFKCMNEITPESVIEASLELCPKI